MRKFPLTDRWPQLFLGTVFVVLSLRGLGDAGIGYPDADRIIMDGIFIHDFLHALGKMDFTHFGFHTLYDFTTAYYAQYPALSIGYRPPFFPLIEALFLTVFGVNHWAPRLAVTLLALVAVGAWFALIRRLFDRPTAFAATLLLVTSPFIIFWSWFTMLDVPVLSMTLITAYFLYRYTEQQQPRFLYATVMAFSLALWTKQTAVFMLLWFLPYLYYRKSLRPILTTPSGWGAIILAVILIAPLAAMTLWLGELNLAQSLGDTKSRLSQVPRYHWANLRVAFDFLFSQVTKPVLSLALLGLVWSFLRRDGKVLFFVFWLAATYIFFTALNDPKVPRYTIFWVPAFLLFAALCIHYLPEKLHLKSVGMAVVGCIALYQAQLTIHRQQDHSYGYEAAARMAIAQASSPVIFVDALNNGYFTFFVRLNDPLRQFYVLRGDKLLHSSAMEVETWQKVHIQSLDGLRRLFDQFGVSVVVVESRNYAGLEIHRLLRDWLQTADFRLIKKIPVVSTRDRLRHQSLLVYHYLHFKPPSRGFIELDLPIVGKTIRVPFKGGTNESARPSPP